MIRACAFLLLVALAAGCVGKQSPLSTSFEAELPITGVLKYR